MGDRELFNVPVPLKMSATLPLRVFNMPLVEWKVRIELEVFNRLDHTLSSLE